jgi:predicted NBD/HSP70 family sugar kinase
MPETTGPPLYAAIAIEDQSLRLRLVSYDGSRLRVTRQQTVSFNPDILVSGEETYRGLIHANLKPIMPEPPVKLAGIGISSPGTVDTHSGNLTDLPRRKAKQVPNTLAIINFQSEVREWLAKGGRVVAANDTIMSAYGERWERIGNRAPTPDDDFAYIRVGTGINGGVFVNARPLCGAQNPEMGHIRVHLHDDDLLSIPPVCTAHSRCLEGYVGYARLEKLAVKRGWEKVFDIASYYIAQLCHVLRVVAAPRQIVIGGTTIERHGDSLLRRIENSFAALMEDYPHNRGFSIVKAQLDVAEASWRGALWAALDPNFPGTAGKRRAGTATI